MSGRTDFPDPEKEPDADAAGVTRIAIPRDGPLFEGHFPGRPILPGVAQIGLILEALGAGATRRRTLRAIPSMRLRRLVLPGDELRLASRTADGSLRFELTRDRTLVANGELVLGEDGFPAKNADRLDLADGRPLTSPPPLLPHQPPMRFITSILARSDNGLRCEARIPSACGLASGQRAPAYACIEAAAQCAATWEALRRIASGGAAVARLGYLVAMRGIELSVREVPTDQPLTATIVIRDVAMPLSRYDVEVTFGSDRIVRGQIATMLTDQRVA